MYFEHLHLPYNSKTEGQTQCLLFVCLTYCKKEFVAAAYSGYEIRQYQLAEWKKGVRKNKMWTYLTI